MKKRFIWQMLACVLAAALCLSPAAVFAEKTESSATANAESGKVTLRVCNWEEYIDLGDWDEEETIDLDSGDIIGENSMVEDFQEWYKDTYGIDVEVEYSTFGTNEDLYNMLTLGDVYDLVCPSEYMFMKLIAEDLVEPFSESFFDETDENNYYTRGVSPYIREIFENHEINGKPWADYAAGYMWGVTGIVYNPKVMTHEEAETWTVLADPKYKRQVTIKDNVRDSYFAAVGALKKDLLLDPSFTGAPDYAKRLEEEMNDISPETIKTVQKYLQDVKKNAYSFETDSGKADMITGKVVANYQWSGDAVYSMDQAEEDDYILNFAVPAESTNIYFDGWVMLKAGIDGNAARQHAAEAFVNFLSRPDNVVRNMYYIGYTSAIAGGDDPRVFEYCDWCYGAEEEEEDGGEVTEEEEASDEEDEASEESPESEADGETSEKADAGEEEEAGEEELVEYPLGYFFSGDAEDEDYTLTVSKSQLIRQLGAQYPSEEVMARSSIMVYFDAEQNEAINQMWINVRCFSILEVPVYVWGILGGAAVLTAVFFILRARRRKKIYG